MERGDICEFYRDLFDLEDKVAVVVGGTGVLCGMMARGLWQAGCKAVLVGRNRQKAEAHFQNWRCPPEDAWFQEADVRQRREVEAIIPAVLERFGRIDIWINGAAMGPPNNYIDIPDEQYDEVLELNLKAVHTGCQVIGRHWIDTKKQGCIINMSSMSALRPLSRNFLYSMSKAALLNLTQNLAREWAEFGIRVNALCPGFLPAEQNRAILDKERVKNILWHTPMGRFGEPEELIGATLLLASEKAGRFITGCNLVVDGGFSVKSI